MKAKNLVFLLTVLSWFLHIPIRVILIPAFFILFPVACFAQVSDTRDFGISSTGHFGFIIGHSGKMAALIKGHIYGEELNFIKPTYGEKTWQQVYRFPEVGISILNFNLANQDQLGNLYALYPYINFPIVYRKRLKLYFRAGNGISFVSKHFHRTENHKNTAIGSAWNELAVLRLNGNIRLSPRLRLETGFGLTHFSNGAFSIPNLGLNMVTVKAGLGYTFYREEGKRKTDSIAPVDKQIEKSISFAAALREVEPAGGKKYPAFVLSANLNKSISHKSRIGTGMELLHSSAVIQKLKQDSIPVNSDLDALQLGVKIGYELVIGRISLPLEMGVYILSKYKGYGYFYQRVGFRYRVNTKWYICSTLKSHFANADYYEWGMGYVF